MITVGIGMMVSVGLSERVLVLLLLLAETVRCMVMLFVVALLALIGIGTME